MELAASYRRERLQPYRVVCALALRRGPRKPSAENSAASVPGIASIGVAADRGTGGAIPASETRWEPGDVAPLGRIADRAGSADVHILPNPQVRQASGNQDLEIHRHLEFFDLNRLGRCGDFLSPLTWRDHRLRHRGCECEGECYENYEWNRDGLSGHCFLHLVGSCRIRVQNPKTPGYLTLISNEAGPAGRGWPAWIGMVKARASSSTGSILRQAESFAPFLSVPRELRQKVALLIGQLTV